MLRKTLLILAVIFLPVIAQTQTPASPKLVVGVVVDQMRYDFLYRYRDSYSENGFKRLLKEGFSCENTHFNYAPTYTGPGHAAIYTGTTPAINGIIANEWWDPQWNRRRYVTEDTLPSVKTVGSPEVKVGQHSPRVLMSSTITDELKLAYNFRSKVVGVCLKDRGSILPAGHIPDGAYWFDDKTGNWITSTYYAKTGVLPDWVTRFNQQGLPEKYLAQGWKKIEGHEYRQSYDDWKQYEDATYQPLAGDFPYDLNKIKSENKSYKVLRIAPQGTSFTFDFARAAVSQMQLGLDADPDFLCVSLSSTDYCAHQFGIHAEETEDTYLKLDREIGQFVSFLDEKVGRDNYVLFLTADHGGAETPEHLKALNFGVGVFDEDNLEKSLENTLGQYLGMNANLIKYIANQQIWLDWDVIDELEINPSDVASVIAQQLRDSAAVYDVFTRDELMTLPADYPFAPLLRGGIHPKRSGDIIYQLNPGWHSEVPLFGGGGTTHGSTYAYDTHVPLIWFGGPIRPGETFSSVNITDIAPTLAAMLRIMEPNGCTGKVIESVMKR